MKRQLLISMLFAVVALTSCSKDGDQISEGMSDGSTRSSGIYIPDANFKAYLVANFDRTNDGEISSAEAGNVETIVCSGRNISSLVGIEHFNRITHLDCSNNNLTSINLPGHGNLHYIDCSNNQLTSINVSPNSGLFKFYCDNNNLTSINVSGKTALTDFHCYNNRLTSLDISTNHSLRNFDCSPMAYGFRTLYVNRNQSIQYVTVNRNNAYIPAQTNIEYR